MLALLADGQTITIRPISKADRTQLAAALSATSEQSRFLRFMRVVDRLTEAELDYLVNVDGVNHVALVAVLDGGQGIGVARYIRDTEDPSVAEAAVMVLDAHHGQGVGTALVKALADVALSNDISRFTAYVLPENRAAIDGLTKAGAVIEQEDTLLRMTVNLPLEEAMFSQSALRMALRGAAAGDLTLDDQL
jgi:RimJ/RimL family protein N-acetyltransferase